MKRFSEDRDELLGELNLLYPRLEAAAPSEKVEIVLTDICGFHVVDEPLCFGQMALCDFSNRVVIVNSEMDRFVPDKERRDMLRPSTLAHELGHIRLHADEIAEGYTVHFYGESGRFTDSRSFQKEREADLYAGLFLVPLEELLTQRSIQSLLRNKMKKKQMRSGSLWNLVYKYAEMFKVSPSLMKRWLVDMGWIELGDRRKCGPRKLMVRF